MTPTLPLIEDTDGESILRWLQDEPLTAARMDHMLGNWGSGKTEQALERLHSYGYIQCEGNNRYYSLWSLTGKGKEFVSKEQGGNHAAQEDRPS